MSFLIKEFRIPNLKTQKIKIWFRKSLQKDPRKILISGV